MSIKNIMLIIWTSITGLLACLVAILLPKIKKSTKEAEELKESIMELYDAVEEKNKKVSNLNTGNYKQDVDNSINILSELAKKSKN